MKDYNAWLNEYAPTFGGPYGNVQQTGTVTNRMGMLNKSLASQKHMNFRRKVNMILRSLNAIPFESQEEMQKALWRAYISVRQGQTEVPEEDNTPSEDV